ncbi:DUF3159 domain-containing protein [Alloscardovia criceti]|uniref:DUF3159 domain-containing protein n=1 Tax=Alloscardovia criceti TaxID=356828 RepID=UPI0003604190|nr:DUF3159 domain-containing protein [Alloscardovia criceti]
MTDTKNNQGLKSIANSTDNFSVWEAIGGIRGIVEAVLPVLVFIIGYIISSDLVLSLIIVGALLVVIVIARLIQRQTLMGALSGVIVTLISVVFAAMLNSARDFYSPGILINTVAVSALLVSLVAKKPGIGWMLEQITHDNALKDLYKTYVYATWVWICGFGIRLAVEVPLYMAHNISALGIARIITGIPLFALMLLVSWIIVAPQRKKLLETREEAKETSD